MSEREINDLAEAIKNDKFWYALPGNKQFIFVVALSRARIKREKFYLAKATYLKQIYVPKEIKEFIRRFMIILVERETRKGKVVMSWKTFLSLMKSKRHALPYILSLSVPKKLSYKDIDKLTESPQRQDQEF
ncbi:MAG: hypothetical protein ACPLN2_07480 [Thermoproteota archaeon]|jgi:hypothetical protein